MTKLTVRFSNNISHSSDEILNCKSYHTPTNGVTYTVFQLALILRVTRDHTLDPSSLYKNAFMPLISLITIILQSEKETLLFFCFVLFLFFVFCLTKTKVYSWGE